MGRSSRRLTTLAVARRNAVTLVSALLLAGCFGAKTPAENAADYARANASAQGLTVKSVRCSPRGEVAWTCKGRLRSGRAFTCSVGPTGRSPRLSHAQCRRTAHDLYLQQPDPSLLQWPPTVVQSGAYCSQFNPYFDTFSGWRRHDPLNSRQKDADSGAALDAASGPPLSSVVTRLLLDQQPSSAYKRCHAGTNPRCALG